MKIKKIEIKNFRQFKGQNIIDFNTDGKITVILGDNGTGKTTLMQFFNWVFYGNYYFDNDVNGKLYNLECDNVYSFGTVFSVEGTINFIHEGVDYRLNRTKQYVKKYNSSEEEGKSVSLIFKDEYGNWTPYADVERKINEIIPRALSRYFLFDGERKISDFNMKSGDTLEKAIFSMFDIDIIKNAYDHIGELSTTNSLLGKIARLKSSSKSGLNKKAYEYLKIAQENNDRALVYKRKIETDEHNERQIRNIINELSQKIGQAKNTKEIEDIRNRNIENINDLLKKIRSKKSLFGKMLYKSSPYLLLAEKAYIASEKIHENEPNKKVVYFEGVRKDLLRDILSKRECVCGTKIGDSEEEHINHIIDTMPPNSYKSIFEEFRNRTHRLLTTADKDFGEVSTYFKDIHQSYNEIGKLEKLNKEYLELMKQFSNAQNLIEAREEQENNLKKIQERIKFNYGNMRQCESNRDTARKYFEKASGAEKEQGKYEQHIEIARIAKEYFEKLLRSQIIKSKKSLEENIREVYNKVSTTERKNIYLNNDYTLVVKNDDDSTYKSGGQDIIIMYSYIGGILKTLQNMGLENEGKEYPLIIDAPFSKVDGSQLGSVTDALSKVAPQVIIMTFDSDRLDTRADRNLFGKIWRIESNAAKNISEIKESTL